MAGQTNVRKQIYITEDEEKMLREQAFVQKTSQAQIIRQALEVYRVLLSGARDLEATLKRLVKDDKTRNPLDKIIGMFDDDVPADVSEHHDRYLYGEGKA